jgi:hypothetical protein
MPPELTRGRWWTEHKEYEATKKQRMKKSTE